MQACQSNKNGFAAIPGFGAVGVGDVPDVHWLSENWMIDYGAGNRKLNKATMSGASACDDIATANFSTDTDKSYRCCYDR
jgi:hypothetical protein